MILAFAEAGVTLNRVQSAVTVIGHTLTNIVGNGDAAVERHLLELLSEVLSAVRETLASEEWLQLVEYTFSQIESIRVLCSSLSLSKPARHGMLS